jgi:hypothetical protein
MAFLEKAELKTVSQIPAIDKITNADGEVVTELIEESISVMKGLLSAFYDTGKIFSAEADDRNKTVLKYLKNIVIFEIYTRLNWDVNRTLINRYNEAMQWLENMNEGKWTDKTLPLSGDEGESPQNDFFIRFGSGERYLSDF